MTLSRSVAMLIVILALLWSGAGEARRLSKVDRVLNMSDRAKARLPVNVKLKAVQKHGLKAVALRQGFLRRHNTHYRYQVPMERKPHVIRDQKSSGRCWAFATDRVMESKQVKAGKPGVELSKSFINYHSLRHTAINLLNKAAVSHGRQPRLAASLGEGANQTRAMKILEQYGAVPESKMPTTSDSQSSGVFLAQLQTMVARASGDFARVKKGPEAKAQLISRLQDYHKEVDALLKTTVGKPPRKFKVDGKFYTPKTYAKALLGGGAATADYVVLTHDPSKGWNRRYKMTDAAGLIYEAYNVPMASLQKAVKRTIRGGEAVYFSANASANNPHRAGTSKAEPKAAAGILAVGAFDYKSFVPYKQLSKRQQVKSGVTPANHAMAITGYDPKPGGRGKVSKWKVDNSWGEKAGDKGHFHMYDDYFKHYVSKVQVPRSAVPAAMLAAIEGSPVVEPGARKKGKK